MSDNYIEEVRLPSARYEAHFNFDASDLGINKSIEQLHNLGFELTRSG